MALGLNEDGYNASDRKDERFLVNVQDWLGRDTTVDEEELAFNMRDQHGYSAKEAATEIAACAAAA
jgi:hypothetical protein